MGFYWDEFLRDVAKDFICYSSLPKILECFYYYCNDKKKYYSIMIDHCAKRGLYDIQYWQEQYNYLINGENNGK